MTTNSPFSEDADMVWAALQSAALEAAPDISPDLLRRAYLIQRRHQFDQSDRRQDSYQDLVTLVDEFIAATEENK